MAKYSGEYTETFTVDVPIDEAKAHFSDLQTVAKHYGGVAEWKIQKNKTLKLVLEPRTEIGVRFQGWHSIRYTFADDHELEWKSVGPGNMKSKGAAIFKPIGRKKTQIKYFDSVECDVDVNFLVAPIIGPIISRQIRDRIKTYLKSMRNALEGAARSSHRKGIN
jgi:carbon monoxide dehydrogenase subunit G